VLAFPTPSGGVSQGVFSDFLTPTSFTATAVTGKLITGFSSGAGTVAATDTILQAINKLDGNVAGKQAAGSYAASIPPLTDKWPITSIAKKLKSYGLVLAPTNSTWDQAALNIGDIVKTGGTYYMVYGGAAADPSANPQYIRPWSVGLASSTDLLTWTKLGNILPTPPQWLLVSDAMLYLLRIGNLLFVYECPKTRNLYQ